MPQSRPKPEAVGDSARWDGHGKQQVQAPHRGTAQVQLYLESHHKRSTVVNAVWERRGCWLEVGVLDQQAVGLVLVVATAWDLLKKKKKVKKLKSEKSNDINKNNN